MTPETVKMWAIKGPDGDLDNVKRSDIDAWAAHFGGWRDMDSRGVQNIDPLIEYAKRKGYRAVHVRIEEIEDE